MRLARYCYTVHSLFLFSIKLLLSTRIISIILVYLLTTLTVQVMNIQLQLTTFHKFHNSHMCYSWHCLIE